MRSCYYSLILMVFLTSCVHHSSRKVPVSVEQLHLAPVVQNHQVSVFNQVNVQGQINLDLHTGYKKNQVMLKGDPRDLAQIKIQVNDRTLYLVLGKGFPHHGPIHALVQTEFLNRIQYVGAGTVTGNNLRSSVMDVYLANYGITRLGGTIGLRQLEVINSGLTEISGIQSSNLQIHLKGTPRLRLAGIANVTQLRVDDNSWLSMYWLRSDNLTLRAHQNARIQLAGTVNRLDLELWGSAHFQGRYLRAQRSFVKTHDHARAEVSSVNHQSTLARDASDIYYYNMPNTRQDFMVDKGSVLDMREWTQTELRDFDRYNKQFP